MKKFENKYGKQILLAMVHEIQDNKAYLGEVDGLIGDGDHGANMNKGFTLFATRILDREITFSKGLGELGMILFSEIGGSMGPIYGTIFMEMEKALPDAIEISLADFKCMLEAGLLGLSEIVEAKSGDKTLVDTLSPAVESLKKSMDENKEFDVALIQMKEAVENGKDSTKNMVARFGRSSRLGERSRGVLDAGAVSCSIILCAMADEILKLLQ